MSRVLVLLCLAALACADRVTSPVGTVPLSRAYPAIGSNFTEQPATSTDSRVPTISARGDTVDMDAVLPPLCGRDTVTAGARNDSVVVTLYRTAMPYPCAVSLPDVHLHVEAFRLPSPPHHALLSVETVNLNGDTTRAVVTTAMLSQP